MQHFMTRDLKVVSNSINKIKTILIGILFIFALVGCVTPYIEPKTGDTATLRIPKPQFSFSSATAIITYADALHCTSPSQMANMTSLFSSDKTVTIPAGKFFTLDAYEVMYIGTSTISCSLMATFLPVANQEYTIKTAFDEHNTMCSLHIVSASGEKIPLLARTPKIINVGAETIYGPGFGTICDDAYANKTERQLLQEFATVKNMTPELFGTPLQPVGLSPPSDPWIEKYLGPNQASTLKNSNSGVNK
jgi:hypothetical protein